MPSTATSIQTEDSAANLAFYRVRDDFVRAYQPVTDQEKLLVVQLVRSWQHLQEVYQLRDQLTAEKGLLGLFEENFEKYKHLMRTLSAAERMWRNADLAFQRARRLAVRSGAISMAGSMPQRRTGPTPLAPTPPRNETTPPERRNVEGESAGQPPPSAGRSQSAEPAGRPPGPCLAGSA